MKYFYSSLWVTVLGLFLGAGVGYYYKGTLVGALEALFICFVLSILEVSISFDNAVVNATVLRKMTPLWQRRFLTWGMLIAVFGMRLVFPLLIVAIVAGLGPWQALVLAATSPDRYAQIMTSVHHQVAAFGGAFLMLVALKYFYDEKKDLHWIHLIERPVAILGRLEAIEVGITLLFIYAISRFLDPTEQLEFVLAGVGGVLTFLAVEGVGTFLQAPDEAIKDIHRASIGMFLYLEVLDASFSFDGVIGAFAITNNLFIIAVGLGIGAMFVRSLTIMMVEKETLESFRYLEHGAFYAVGALSVIMFIGTIWHIPEVITGLVGAAFIGFSLLSSIRYKKSLA